MLPVHCPVSSKCHRCSGMLSFSSLRGNKRSPRTQPTYISSARYINQVSARESATGSVRHKRTRCNSDMDNNICDSQHIMMTYTLVATLHRNSVCRLQSVKADRLRGGYWCCKYRVGSDESSDDILLDEATPRGRCYCVRKSTAGTSRSI
jgi:hypothetical protein